MSDVKDTWSAGELYEPYVGRWSRLVAREFLRWLGVPHGGRWLDVGCGTGALAQTILEMENPSHVVGIDPSSEFIAHARMHIRDPRAQFEVRSAEQLSAGAENFDAIVSALMINFVARPDQAIVAMRKAVNPGGIVAAYVWDYADKMKFMRYFWDTAQALDPKAVELDESRRFPICNSNALGMLFREADLRDVTTHAIDIVTTFANFDDFWHPFLGGQGPAPSYLSTLSSEHRERLRVQLLATLPTAADGSIRMIARAWAVRGMR